MKYCGICQEPLTQGEHNGICIECISELEELDDREQEDDCS
jgi:hypothetical protein